VFDVRLKLLESQKDYAFLDKAFKKISGKFFLSC
jgi:hypothetical protein